MSEIITREDGTEIEVFTQEEVEEQNANVLETYKTENPDKSEEMETLKKELEEKQAELEKIGNKDQNFKRLRDQKSELEEKLEKATGEMSEKLEAAITNLAGDKKADIINSLVGDDEELKKKVFFHYNRIKDEAKTKEEISAKVNDAYFLATKQEAPSGNFISSAGAGNVKSKAQITPGEKEIGDALGITDEDRKKYSK